MSRIFVYGTLRRGMYNYDTYLKEEDTFRSYGYIKGTLYTIISKTYPAFLNDGNDMVLGEIHEVSDETLKLVDEMEGFHKKGYIENDYDKVICDVYDENQNVIDHLPVYIYNMEKQMNVTLLGTKIHCNDYVQYVSQLNKESLTNDVD